MQATVAQQGTLYTLTRQLTLDARILKGRMVLGRTQLSRFIEGRNVFILWACYHDVLSFPSISSEMAYLIAEVLLAMR
jgi:hypothetical protein